MSNIVRIPGTVAPVMEMLESVSQLYRLSNGHATIAEAAAAVPELAGTVAREPIYLAGGVQVPDQFATVRTLPNGSRQALGVVGPRYHVLQDNRALELLKPLEDSGELNSFNAGAYRAKTWLYGELVGHKAEIVRGDEITLRALVGNSHDGSIPWSIGFPGNRVVCQNTFHMAMAPGISKLLRLRHTVASEDIIKQIEELIQTMGGAFLRTADQFRHLAARTCTDTQLKEYTERVFSIAKNTEVSEDTEANEVSERAPRVLPRIVENFQAGRGADLARGTFWGAYNAATEYITHQRGRGTDNAKFADNQWGMGAMLAKRALDVATQMAA